MIAATAVCSRLLTLSLEHTLLGTVHSVFEHAVNLEIVERAGLIGLIAREQALTPYAVSARTELPFDRAGVRAGMAASICGGRVAIPEAGIELDLAVAESFDLSVDSIAINDPEAGVVLGKRIERALLDADAESSLAPLATGLEGNTYTRFLAPRLQKLFAAVATGSAEAAIFAAGNAAGCGMGLTPSSDDLLTGYISALYLLFRAKQRDPLRGMLPRMAAAAAERTNRLSATFLLHSGEGLANLAVCDLYRSAFQFTDEAAAARAIARILAIGSTSGADMLTGICLALRQHNGGNESW